MKWINNGIKYERGNYEGLIARFNNAGAWFTLRAMATQQTQKSEFKLLADYFEDEIKVCEVKNLYDEDGNETETNVIVFDFHYDGTCHFYVATHKGLVKIEL